eukprot:15451205-Alexandrium_andersonii.AAC.1
MRAPSSSPLCRLLSVAVRPRGKGRWSWARFESAPGWGGRAPPGWSKWVAPVIGTTRTLR